MSAADLTLFAGTAGMLLSSIAIPAWRRFRHRLASTDATREVSWEAINLALVKERDRATAALEVQRLAHTEEMAQMRERHRTEINSLRTKWEDDAAEMRRGLDREASEMKQRYDEELSKLSSRLADCQKTVNELYKKIFELQNRPPDARSTGNGAPGVT